jgi:hypothetical protein
MYTHLYWHEAATSKVLTGSGLLPLKGVGWTAVVTAAFDHAIGLADYNLQ